MSHKASRKDEEDLKEFQATKTAQDSEPGKVDIKALEKELTGKGIHFSTFANADEHYRKRTLKEDYAALKLKHGWLYDQPIEGLKWQEENALKEIQKVNT